MSPSQSSCHRCSHCAREFVRAEHLVRHERIHTKEKPFKCKICDESFSRSDLLRRHERKAHPRSTSSRISRQHSSPARQGDIRIVCGDNAAPETCRWPQLNIADRANPLELAGEQAGIPPLSDTDLALSLAESLLPDDLFWLDQLQAHSLTPETQQPIQVLPDVPGGQSILSRAGSPLLQSIPTDSSSTDSVVIPDISQTRWQSLQAVLVQCGYGKPLPAPFTLSQLVRRYFESFHRHQPFLHAATWSFETAHDSLILAMAASGSLYSLEGDTAEDLYQAAVVCLQSEKTGLWALQSLMVLTAFRAWSGRPDNLQTALNFYGQMTILVRREWAQVPYQDGGGAETWERWCERESLKRITYCIFTLMTLVSIAFDIPTPVQVENRFGMPCHESQWTAKTAEEWSQLVYSPAGIVNTEQLSAIAVVEQLMNDESQHIPAHISAFGCHIIISCLVQRIILFRQALPEPGDGDQRPMYHRFLRALRRWQQIWEREPNASLSPSSPQGPMLFNSTALLRVAYMRLAVDHSSVRQAFSWCDSVSTIEASIWEASPVRRGPSATRAALHACLALRVPEQLGFNVVSRTSFWVWSVQHPICYFECAVVLSQWLLSFAGPSADGGGPGLASISGEEWRVLDLVSQVVSIPILDASNAQPPTGNVLIHLTSAVLYRWAQLLDTKETTVWGLIPKLSHVLRLHAEHITTKYR